MIEDELLKLSTTDFVPAIVHDGACICWPANVLRVPIPLIDFRWLEERVFGWATIQTPFGSAEPLFGLVRYASQNRMECKGSAFYDAQGKQICAVVSNGAFGFPSYTVEKLQKKAKGHFERLRTDALYAREWEHHWQSGISMCIQAGQPA